MAGYHDEQENINTAKHIWHSGGKWVAAVLVAGALGYVGYVAYKGRVHQGSAQAAQLAAQVKGDAAKLAALQQQFPKDTATTQARCARRKAKLKRRARRINWRWINCLKTRATGSLSG